LIALKRPLVADTQIRTFAKTTVLQISVRLYERITSVFCPRSLGVGSFVSLKRVPVPVTEATRPLALEVPTLRFPEFSSCWKNARLADIVVGGFSNGVFNDPAKVGSGYRLINVKDMYLSGTINSRSQTHYVSTRSGLMRVGQMRDNYRLFDRIAWQLL
jgi:hypothetical protein